MHFLTRYFVLFPLTLVFSFLTVSCSESKSSQCDKIIKVNNEVVSQTKAVANGGQSIDPKAALQVADSMEKASQHMKSIRVSDTKLKGYQSRFMNMYRDTSKATREFVAAFEKKDRPAVETALTKLQKATSPEKQLVEEINTYCSAK